MTYPKYYRSAAHNIKAINSQTSLWVKDTGIENMDWHDEEHLKALEATESTETEFKKAFNKTSKYLKSLI